MYKLLTVTLRVRIIGHVFWLYCTKTLPNVQKSGRAFVKVPVNQLLFAVVSEFPLFSEFVFVVAEALRTP